MITKYTCENGIELLIKTPIHEIIVIENDEKVTTVNLAHTEFKRGAMRTMKGKYSGKIQRALAEYVESLGIETIVRERENGTHKELIK